MYGERFDYTDDGRVYLQAYGLERYAGQGDLDRPAILILPGGGYTHQSLSECEPVAITWAAKGYSTFILYYSCNEYAVWPDLVQEVAWGMKTIRDHADEWHINADQIAVMGFSAGGSLTAMYSTQWHLPETVAKLGCDSVYVKPNAGVVCYGLSYVDQSMAAETADGQGVGKIMQDRDPHLTVLDFVDENTAPMFIWATRYDEYVDSRQSLMLAAKLDEADLPYELMITQSGVHGLSVNNRVCERRGRPIDPSVERWVDQCDIWLQKTFGYQGWVSPANAGAKFL